MKEEEDMESMKNGVTPQLPWAEGKAWGDSSVAGLGRQTVWVGARGWTAAGEYLGGEGRKEEMRERDEERENRTPGGLNHRVRTPIGGPGRVQGSRVGCSSGARALGPDSRIGPPTEGSVTPDKALCLRASVLGQMKMVIVPALWRRRQL